MLQLILLGIIGLGAAFVWVYFNKHPKKAKPVQPDQEEGKIIYLFPDSNDEEGADGKDMPKKEHEDPIDKVNHIDDDKNKDGD